MPAFAPRATVLAEKQRGANARQAHYAGALTLAGTTYACMLHIGPVEPSLDSATGNAFLAQRGEAQVLKTLLTTAPKRDAVLTISGLEYLVESASASLHSPVWVVKFYRLPPKS